MFSWSIHYLENQWSLAGDPGSSIFSQTAQKFFWKGNLPLVALEVYELSHRKPERLSGELLC